MSQQNRISKAKLKDRYNEDFIGHEDWFCSRFESRNEHITNFGEQKNEEGRIEKITVDWTDTLLELVLNDLNFQNILDKKEIDLIELIRERILEREDKRDRFLKKRDNVSKDSFIQTMDSIAIKIKNEPICDRAIYAIFLGGLKEIIANPDKQVRPWPLNSGRRINRRNIEDIRHKGTEEEAAYYQVMSDCNQLIVVTDMRASIETALEFHLMSNPHSARDENYKFKWKLKQLISEYKDRLHKYCEDNEELIKTAGIKDDEKTKNDEMKKESVIRTRKIKTRKGNGKPKIKIKRKKDERTFPNFGAHFWKQVTETYRHLLKKEFNPDNLL